jgi:hypothetical protein
VSSTGSERSSPSSVSDARRISISSAIYPSNLSHRDSVDQQLYPSGSPSSPSSVHSMLLFAQTPDSPGADSFMDLASPRSADAPTFRTSRQSSPERPPLAVATNVPAPPVLAPAPAGKAAARPLPTVPSGKAAPVPDRARAELVRKTQKLTQVFGQTPSADALTAGAPSGARAVFAARRGHRGAVSVATPRSSDEATGFDPRAAWPPPDHTTYMSGNGRRHSTPLTPDELSFLAEITETPRARAYIEIGSAEGGADNDRASMASRVSRPSRRSVLSQELDPGSPASFMDFSDAHAASL